MLPGSWGNMERLAQTAAHVLAGTTGPVPTLAPDAPVLAALELMAARDAGVVVVLDGERIAGIVTERDYARKVELAGQAARDTRLAAIMTTPVIAVPPSAALLDCARLLHEHRIHHLPVVEGGRLLGILSGHDVLEALVAAEARQLKELATERLLIDTGSY